MFSRLTTSPPELWKWCAYALILLAPGSFIVLPAIWLVRMLGVQVAREHGAAPHPERLNAS